MATIEVRLGEEAGRGAWFRLRPLEGHDEVVAGERDAFAATRLLGRLLVESDVGPADAETAWELPLRDRDRLLAEVYRYHFRDTVELVATCAACEEPFDLRFSLAALTRQLDAARPAQAAPDDDGVYTLDDGLRFRLPTARDQREVWGLEPDDAAVALARRCVIDPDETFSVEAAEQAIEQAGAVLDQDLPATCPHCGRDQVVRFDIQDHLLAALEHERAFLVREVHCVASAYGWSLGEILALPRADRRDYVRLIQADARERR